jgi:exodeoxyribonuclease V alpha subunit
VEPNSTFHRAEVALAAGLLRLLDAPADGLPWFQAVDWSGALGWCTKRRARPWHPEQQAAVRLALTERVAMLTGWPGCGKSYTGGRSMRFASRTAPVL